MTSMILAAEALIWMCQPSAFTRADSGCIISGVVAPAWARLNRMPRAPMACMRRSSASVTVSLTTTTARAFGPMATSASSVQDVMVAVRGIGGRLELRDLGARRPLDRLRVSGAGAFSEEPGGSRGGHRLQQLAAIQIIQLHCDSPSLDDVRPVPSDR